MARIVREDVAASRTGDGGVTGFSAEWLALREPADARARDAGLTAQLAQLMRERSLTRLIDLACGTGANVRYLAPRIDAGGLAPRTGAGDITPCVDAHGLSPPTDAGGHPNWLLVDNDATLLEAADKFLRDEPAGSRVETQRVDLAGDWGAVGFDRDAVVTASALLDLVSERWLADLVERCRAGRCIALFALTYDGRMTLTPTDPEDEWICQLVNRHQLGDKGFGPALGPAAAHRVGDLFRAAGYHVRTAPSDWHLLPTEQPLQQSLLEGWAAAAAELACDDADRCRQWLNRRKAHLASGTSRITVGHQDLLAWPRD
jgi:hypothetical protein